MTKYFQFKSKPNVLPPDNTVWRNTEETKIPIIDGKVSFYDESTGAYFDLYVTQVKGRGVADADKLVNLSDKHRMVIQRLIDMDWDQYTSEQILKIIENYYKSTGETFKSNPYKRTISELFRRGLLTCPLGIRHPPKYTLNKEKALSCLKSGKFNDTCPKCDKESSFNSQKEMFCKGCGMLVHACTCT